MPGRGLRTGRQHNLKVIYTRKSNDQAEVNTRNYSELRNLKTKAQQRTLTATGFGSKT